jgi:hypothetical protein
LDSRCRSGYFGLAFERLVHDPAQRSISLDTSVARFTLTRHDNVVSCICDLWQDTPQGLEALRRRGAADSTFMISRKMPPKEFGQWLEALLLEDLGGDPEGEVEVKALLLETA